MPVLVLAFVALGVGLRLAHPEHAYPWYDEFRTLLHASGHSYEDLLKLTEEPGLISAGEIQRRYLSPSPDRGILADIASSMRTDLNVSPLYNGLVRVAQVVASPPLVAARYVSALASVAVLPAFFWLCRELFGSWRIAWVGLALVAVSPSQLGWAFEARAYALWTAAFLASTAALVRCLSVGRRSCWVLYTAMTALMLWCHLLSAFVLVAHAALVLWHGRSKVLPFGLALAASLAGASPWLVRCALEWNTRVAPQLGWFGSERRWPIWGHLSYAIGHGLWTSSDLFRSADVAMMFAVLALEVVAWIGFLRVASPRERVVCGGLALGVLVPLAALDLVFGGQRMNNVRFLLPTTFAVFLVVAHRLASSSSRLVPLLGLLALGAVTCVQSAATRLPEGKWRTEPVTLATMQRAIEQARNPVIVSFGQVSIPATLSLVVPDDLPFLFVRSSADWAAARSRLGGRTVLLIDSSRTPWYYEPNAEPALALLRELAPGLSARYVARGLLLVTGYAGRDP